MTYPDRICKNAAPIRYSRTRPTWRMTRIELAKVWAEHHGIHTHASGGGWLYDRSERPYIQGWDSLARKLERRGTIIVGTGIVWTA